MDKARYTLTFLAKKGSAVFKREDVFDRGSTELDNRLMMLCMTTRDPYGAPTPPFAFSESIQRRVDELPQNVGRNNYPFFVKRLEGAPHRIS